MSSEANFLRVVQISDCHLPADPRTPYRGQDADANLKGVWQKVVNWSPDLILLTGDLSEDASQASYERLGALLQTEVPMLALPGNHDVPELMRRQFPNCPGLRPLAHECGNWMILMCDSTVPRRVDGGFSEEGVANIREAMRRSGCEHILIALHHQPVSVAAPWIDQYRLKQAEAFRQAVADEPRVRCVVWGHIHHHFAQEENGILWLGAPSTAANSVARSLRFELDPAGPACRTLQLGSDGSVAYGQLFANAN